MCIFSFGLYALLFSPICWIFLSFCHALHKDIKTDFELIEVDKTINATVESYNIIADKSESLTDKIDFNKFIKEVVLYLNIPGYKNASISIDYEEFKRLGFSKDNMDILITSDIYKKFNEHHFINTVLSKNIID